MSRESIQGPLTALRHAGSVCGVCLVRGTELVVNLFPFSEDRMNEVVALVDDISGFLANQGRQVDQLCFGYDGGSLVIVTDEDYRLIVMHMHPDEVDFIAKAARAFLVDFQVGLFAERLGGADSRLNGGKVITELPPVVIPGEEEEATEIAPSEEDPVPPAEPKLPPETEVISSPGMEDATPSGTKE